MWLQKGAQVVLVPERMPDTIARCLADGWVEVPDPRVMPTQDEPAPEAQPPEPPMVSEDGYEGAQALEPLQLPLRRKGRR